MQPRGEAQQTATMRHVAGFWKASSHHTAIGLALLNLADVLRADTSKPGVVEAYIAALEDLSPEECIVAFSRALETVERWLPSPGQLRRLAGRSESRSLDTEALALEAMGVVIQAMREYGPKLSAKQGPLLREFDDEGYRIKPEYGPDEPCPPFDDATERALVGLGFGKREAGLRLLACHPAIGLPAEDALAQMNIAGVEKRWIQAYTQAVER